MVISYTVMVASFLLIYFGIRSYRDNILAGQISLGRALVCGILIILLTTVCYIATWEILYFRFMPHFMDSYFAGQIQKIQSSGLDPGTTTAQVAAIQHSWQLCQNPFINMAYTFYGAHTGRPSHHARFCCHAPPQSPSEIDWRSQWHDSHSSKPGRKPAAPSSCLIYGSIGQIGFIGGSMASITGFGGIFLRADNPKALYQWYEKHLGLVKSEGSFAFPVPTQHTQVVFSFFKQDNAYFPPAQKAMINLQVDDLDEVLDHLIEESVTVDPKRESYDFGKFGWVIDPEGNRIELWQPV